MLDFLAVILLVTGGVFILVSGYGVLTMPDLYMRMSASTKSSTLGVGCMLLAAALHFDEFGISARLVATVAFIFLTAPVAAHMIGRAGYISGAPLWEGTRVDDLHGRYDLDAGELRGDADAEDVPEGC